MYRAIVSACILTQVTFVAAAGTPAPRAEDLLFILADGTELVGSVVLENARWYFLKAGGTIRQLAKSDVERILTRSELPAEYRRRRAKLTPGAKSRARLARWCRMVGLLKEARELVAEALRIDPASKEALREKKLLDVEDLARVPWKKDDRVLLQVSVFARKGKRTIPLPELSERLASLLATAKPPFLILPPDDKKAKPSYVIRCEVGASVLREHTFYGEIVVSKTWEGKARLFVLDSRGKKKLYASKVARSVDTFPVKARSAEKAVIEGAFGKLMDMLKEQPAFRLKKKAAEDPLAPGPPRRLSPSLPPKAKRP